MWKASRYVYTCDALLPDLHLVYSSRSGALLEVAERDWPQVTRLMEAPNDPDVGSPDLRRRLERALVLVPADEDEVRSVRHHRTLGKQARSWLGLTIAPTLQCNFRCVYCFEEHRAEHMTPDVVAALERFILDQVDRAGAPGIGITWFGGEPLMQPAVIERVERFATTLAAERAIGRTRSLVTNGYLLDSRMTERLLALGPWEMVQVTIDGDPLIHDGRRPLVNGRSTFRRVVENAARASRAGLPVVVRLNVDARNADRDSIANGLSALHAAGAGELIPRVYLGTIIDSTPECRHMADSKLPLRDAARARLTLGHELLRRGAPANVQVPRPACVMCTADSNSGFTIAPTGLMFKCWNEIHLDASRAIGSLGRARPTAEQAQANAAQWTAYDPLDKGECASCKAMPACMGGCPWEAKATRADHGWCGTLKFFPVELVQLAHADRAIHTLASEGGAESCAPAVGGVVP